MVVFFEGREAIGFDRMSPKGIWQCRHGVFHHDEMIGKPFGSKVRNSSAAVASRSGLSAGLLSTWQALSRMIPVARARSLPRCISRPALCAAPTETVGIIAPKVTTLHPRRPVPHACPKLPHRMMK